MLLGNICLIFLISLLHFLVYSQNILPRGKKACVVEAVNLAVLLLMIASCFFLLFFFWGVALGLGGRGNSEYLVKTLG